MVTRLEDSTLVRNTHLAGGVSTFIGGISDGQYGQRFTTGSHAGGYTVTSVGVFVELVSFSGTETVTVYIHEFDDSATNDRGTLIATLTTPTLVAGAVNFFDAPEDTTLDAGTEYIVNFHSTGDSNFDLVIHQISSDEQEGAAGWMIEDEARSSGSLSGNGRSLMIEVRGNANASADATLSDLELTDSADSDVALTPGFASGTTSYSASVDIDTGQITVTPTVNDDGASVEYFDEDDGTLEDADDNTDGQQVSLDSGTNTIKVRVTAEDGVTTQTYTVVVSRAIWEGTLTVRDLGGGSLGCSNSHGTDNRRCSNNGTLSDDDFTYDSTSYDVTVARLTSGGTLRLDVSADLTSLTQELILHVGSDTFRFEDADTRPEQKAGVEWQRSELERRDRCRTQAHSADTRPGYQAGRP